MCKIIFQAPKYIEEDDSHCTPLQCIFSICHRICCFNESWRNQIIGLLLPHPPQKTQSMNLRMGSVYTQQHCSPWKISWENLCVTAKFFVVWPVGRSAVFSKPMIQARRRNESNRINVLWGAQFFYNRWTDRDLFKSFLEWLAHFWSDMLSPIKISCRTLLKYH